MNISIVVPVYNVERYLTKCIDSLINQTSKPFEIILVDDGSTDNSLDICNKYEINSKLIKVYHKENEGLGLTRNFGIDKARGDFILFVDSDDYLDLDYIEKMEEIYKRSSFDTCKTTFRRVSSKGETCPNIINNEIEYQDNEIGALLLPRMIGSSPEKKDSIPMSSCCTLYSLRIIRDNNIRFVSEREWISEDIIFNIDYYNKAKKVILSNYIGYNYRINDNSLTTKYLEDRFIKSLDLVLEEKRILIKSNLWDICRYRLYRQFFLYTKMSIVQLKKADIPKKMKLDKIQTICNDKNLCNMINEYPLSKLGLKQRFFLFLIKTKSTQILYYLFCV